MLPETDSEQAVRVAETIRYIVAEHPFAGKEKQPEGAVTVSIGVATYSASMLTPEELIDAADRALYAAKGRGRNQTVLLSQN